MAVPMMPIDALPGLAFIIKSMGAPFEDVCHSWKVPLDPGIPTRLALTGAETE